MIDPLYRSDEQFSPAADSEVSNAKSTFSIAEGFATSQRRVSEPRSHLLVYTHPESDRRDHDADAVAHELRLRRLNQAVKKDQKSKYQHISQDNAVRKSKKILVLRQCK